MQRLHIKTPFLLNNAFHFLKDRTLGEPYHGLNFRCFSGDFPPVGHASVSPPYRPSMKWVPPAKMPCAFCSNLFCIRGRHVVALGFLLHVKGLHTTTRDGPHLYGCWLEENMYITSIAGGTPYFLTVHCKLLRSFAMVDIGREKDSIDRRFTVNALLRRRKASPLG